MARFDTIDLSRLPAPQVLEALDFEGLNADFIAAFIASAASTGFNYDVAGMETDPVVITGQAFSYQRTLDRARINDAARSVMLAFATGADLEHLAALYGITRAVVTPAAGGDPAVMESDARLRARVQLAPEALATTGTRGGYIFHAMAADPTVTDVGLIVPQPGQVDVIVQAGENGEASSEVVERVRQRLVRDDIRPLTVAVTARPADIVPYSVSAVLEILRGPDPALILANAEASLRAFARTRFRVGHRVPISSLYAALTVAGVERVRLSAPLTDVRPPLDGLARLGGVSLATEFV
jgi:phage-related baseplate assembly protein